MCSKWTKSSSPTRGSKRTTLRRESCSDNCRNIAITVIDLIALHFDDPVLLAGHAITLKTPARGSMSEMAIFGPLLRGFVMVIKVFPFDR